VRSVGELLQNQIRIGLVRMERAIRERLTSGDLTEMMPSDVVNAKPLIASVKEFFGKEPHPTLDDRSQKRWIKIACVIGGQNSTSLFRNVFCTYSSISKKHFCNDIYEDMKKMIDKFVYHEI